MGIFSFYKRRDNGAVVAKMNVQFILAYEDVEFIVAYEGSENITSKKHLKEVINLHIKMYGLEVEFDRIAASDSEVQTRIELARKTVKKFMPELYVNSGL